MRDLGCDVLLSSDPVDGEAWNKEKLSALGYGLDGDKRLILSTLNFSRTLLENCGNRSIYSSSNHLSNLLHTTDLQILAATLEVSLELAKRYQASIRRVNMPSSRPPASLLSSHYNIDLDRIQLLASPFVKTPIIHRSDDQSPVTPTPSSAKAKERATSVATTRHAAVTHLNEISSIVKEDGCQDSSVKWAAWGDIRVSYHPQPSGTTQEQASSQPVETGKSSTSAGPSTPTPLRRCATMGSSHQASRGARSIGHDGNPVSSRTPRADQVVTPATKRVEVAHSTLKSTSLYGLLEKVPEDMPKSALYEYLNRLRISKALLGSSESREQVLAVRLLAITNLAHIYPEHLFTEEVLRQDFDEPRKSQLVYQLVELVHPSTTGNSSTPLWLQTIALSLLDAMSVFGGKYLDVATALNAYATHGVLLYLLRKAVAQMREDGSDPDCEKESWRKALFSLTQAITMVRASPETVTAGLLELLIEILDMRSDLAERTFQSILHFIDNVLGSFQGAFQYFCNANGLEALTNLFIHEVDLSTKLAKSGQGTRPELRSSVMDYQIPYHQQHNLKWLLKFIHHALSNSYLSGGNNTERLLRNLADNSPLLQSIREIIEKMELFGSIVWTASITILSDFLNNDPSSASAILESGLIKTYLMSITGDNGDWSSAAPRPRNRGQEDETQQEVEGHHAGGHSDSQGSSDRDSVHGDTAEFQHVSMQQLRSLAPHGNPAASIHPSTETIQTIPTVLNSICLSRTGQKLVIESNAIPRYFEIFEGPRHVRLLESEPADMAQIVGSSIDELARHHPTLLPIIDRAVIETVARIVNLGVAKAQDCGWGAKLVLTNADGDLVTADERQLWEHGNEKKAIGDLDVEMTDVDTDENAPETKTPSPSPSGPENSITSYICAISAFLTNYTSNSRLRELFAEQGGIELLLDLAQSPALPPQFADSAAAQRLQNIISCMAENYPILAMPSLLKRALKVVETMSPLTKKSEQYPFFTPFILDVVDKKVFPGVPQGTTLARGLLQLQSLIKTLYQCFPISTRHGTIGLHQINVFDYYTRLIQSLGPLLRVVLAEEMALTAMVPPPWLETKSSASATSHAGDGKISDADGRTLEELVLGASQESAADGNKKVPEIEKSSHGFQNFQTLQILLHELMPTTFPFFQNLGKALFPRRPSSLDHWYYREKHWEVADALACAVLDHLEIPGDGPDQKDFHYWIIMLHTVSEMLVDPGRSMERLERVVVIVPVLLAFKEHGGLDKLNAMLRIFMQEMSKDTDDSQQPSTMKKLAFMGTRKILDLYHLILNGRYIHESLNHFNLVPPRPHSERSVRYDTALPVQVILETRITFWPVLVELWQSRMLLKGPIHIMYRVTDILRTIASAEDENMVGRSTDRACLSQLLKRSSVKFNWRLYDDRMQNLIREGYANDLVHEATYRACGDVNRTSEYCKSHTREMAGERNPIPEVDAYQPSQSVNSSLNEERMAVDEGPVSTDEGPMAVDEAAPAAGNAVDTSMGGQPEGDTQNDDGADDESHQSDTAGSPPITSNNPDLVPAPPPIPQPEVEEPPAAVVTKEQMDAKRAELRRGLIDRCLEVLQAHPASAHDVAELITAMMPKEFDLEREEVGETLTNALLSFAAGDDFKENGRTIAAYAHLLSLLLANDTALSQSFLVSSATALAENVPEFLVFVKVPPSSSTDELPPWLPYILLIFEIVLKEDESPARVTWTGPENENSSVAKPVLEVKERVVKDGDRSILLEAVLDLLPRIGRQQILAIAAMRILVILTRNRRMATIVGDKKNLQRLFVMAKQLSTLGSDCLESSRITAHIMTILRNIVEDDETIKEIMRTEIKVQFDFPRSSNRVLEMSNFIRGSYHSVLRSPDLFVAVANEMVRLERFQPRVQQPLRQNIVIKTNSTTQPELTKNGTKQQESTEASASTPASVDLVKETTEGAGKEMIDAQKPATQETKRPVLENPDGVIQFLLNELLNYREVDDKEAAIKDSSKMASSDQPTAGSSSQAADAPEHQKIEGKDKKASGSSKPSFKPEEHPIFIYRCFLLNCIAELLNSYNRTKVEFINFKRNAPMLSHTPVKPRSSVLNYLINDLLCNGLVSDASETIAGKKKHATGMRVQQVLVSLVSRTKEHLLERSRERFDYDDEPDLLFVQKFVLDTVLKAYREASSSNEAFEVRFDRMLCLAELMSHMMGAEKELRHSDPFSEKSYSQIKRLMYEKGYLAVLTHSIADIDLTLPGVKKTIKYILRVLHSLTQTGIQLSHSNIIPASASEEDEIASSTSISDIDDEREETPDLYRNSALGMMEPGGDDFSPGSRDGVFSFSFSPLNSLDFLLLSPFLSFFFFFPFDRFLCLLMCIQMTKRCTMTTSTATRWTTTRPCRLMMRKTSAMKMRPLQL